MTVILKNVYPGATNAADPNFPTGKFQNETDPDVSNDGTPLEEVWQNDMLGSFLAVLSAAGIAPSGTPDTPTASQFLEAVFNLQYSAAVDYQIGTRVNYNGKRWIAVAANGPGSVVEAPGANSESWHSDERVKFDGLYPVGTVYQNATRSVNPNTLLAGGGHSTWALLPGRVLIGQGSYQDANGETKSFALGAGGGEYRHALTAAENGPHTHALDVGYDDSGPSILLPDWNADPVRGERSTKSSGQGTPHNNMQPYRVVSMWVRTA